jgi:hypothetical protein
MLECAEPAQGEATVHHRVAEVGGDHLLAHVSLDDVDRIRALVEPQRVGSVAGDSRIVLRHLLDGAGLRDGSPPRALSIEEQAQVADRVAGPRPAPYARSRPDRPVNSWTRIARQ